MKTSKKCPKCECSHLEKYSGWKDGFGGGNYIRVGRFTSVLVDRIVCIESGYCEEWLSPRGHAIIRKKHGHGTGL